MARPANALEFSRVITGHWRTAMSGSASLVLAFLGTILQSSSAKPLFFTAAIGCFFYAAYRVWAYERNKVVELEALTKSELSCFFDPQDRGCLVRDVPTSELLGSSDASGKLIRKTDWMRLGVNACGVVPVRGCYGRLIRIERDEDTIFEGEVIKLRFAHGSDEDAYDRTVHHGAPEYIDVAIFDTMSKYLLIPVTNFPNSVSVNLQLFGVVQIYSVRSFRRSYSSWHNRRSPHSGWLFRLVRLAQARPANRLENRVDRQLTGNRTGKRRVVVVIRQHGGDTLPAVFQSEAAAVGFIRAHVEAGHGRQRR